jgi:hypothetical protein
MDGAPLFSATRDRNAYFYANAANAVKSWPLRVNSRPRAATFPRPAMGSPFDLSQCRAVTERLVLDARFLSYAPTTANLTAW